MPNKPQRTFTLDENTYASNPGGIKVDFFYYFRSFPNKLVLLIIPLIIFVFVTFSINWIFGFALLSSLREGKSSHLLPSAFFCIAVFNVFLFYAIFSILKKLIFLVIRINEHFRYGCVNPSVVVSTNPSLIAVFTDLTTGKVPRHVIKILPQPLRWMKNGVPSVGTRLATVALYEGIIQKGHWDNFYPIVVNCVTGSQNDIERVFQSIPEWEWEQLEIGINYIRTTKIGLYNIPFVRCEFCHKTVFLPFYPSHQEEHTKPLPDGQMTDHITLPPEKRYQAMFDGIPETYFHPDCNVTTRMPEEIIRSYLVNPFLYNEYTFCCGCSDYILQQELYWCETGQSLADYFRELKKEYIRLHGHPPTDPAIFP
jgi:hypothetical protein